MKFNKMFTLKYSKLEKAIAVAGSIAKGIQIIEGDDGKFWLVTLADGEKLQKAGLKAVSPK